MHTRSGAALTATLALASLAPAQWASRSSPAARAPTPGYARAMPTPAQRALSSAPQRFAPAATPGPRAAPVRPPAAAQLHQAAITRSPWAIGLDSDTTAAAAAAGEARRVTNPVSLTLESISADPAEKERARAAAEAFFDLEVPGREVSQGVRRLLKLRWHGSLAKAAREAEERHRPILWIQALGDLDGFT